MQHLNTFTVTPSLPKRLEPLLEIAHNLWWTWNPEAVELFRRVDHDLWVKTGHNPVMLLGSVDQDRLRQLEGDDVFLAHLDRVNEALTRYLQMPTWATRAHPEFADARMAYFSMEFGLAECLPVYSGGLGVLSGDHFKSTSELGLPAVGVGLLYRQGFFHQSRFSGPQRDVALFQERTPGRIGGRCPPGPAVCLQNRDHRIVQEDRPSDHSSDVVC